MLLVGRNCLLLNGNDGEGYMHLYALDVLKVA